MEIIPLKESIILRHIYIASIKSIGPFRKKLTISVEDIIEYLNQNNAGISETYARDVIYKLISQNILIFTEKVNGRKCYEVNHDLILEKLNDDPVFQLDTRIVDLQFILTPR